MILPPAPDLGMLFVRTDYADELAWRAAFDATTASGRSGEALEPVESPDLDGLDPEALVRLERGDYLGELAVADARTMRDHTVLFVDLDELGGHVGRTFRAIPGEVWSIVANLSLGNMDFSEFADNADGDGVFRGF